MCAADGAGADLGRERRDGLTTVDSLDSIAPG